MPAFRSASQQCPDTSTSRELTTLWQLGRSESLKWSPSPMSVCQGKCSCTKPSWHNSYLRVCLGLLRPQSRRPVQSVYWGASPTNWRKAVFTRSWVPYQKLFRAPPMYPLYFRHTDIRIKPGVSLLNEPNGRKHIESALCTHTMEAKVISPRKRLKTTATGTPSSERLRRIFYRNENYKQFCQNEQIGLMSLLSLLLIFLIKKIIKIRSRLKT